MQVVVSEKYLATDKPIYLVHNFTDQRHEVKVTFNGKLQANKTLPNTFDPLKKDYVSGLNLI